MLLQCYFNVTTWQTTWGPCKCMCCPTSHHNPVSPTPDFPSQRLDIADLPIHQVPVINHSSSSPTTNGLTTTSPTPQHHQHHTTWSPCKCMCCSSPHTTRSPCKCMCCSSPQPSFTLPCHISRPHLVSTKFHLTIPPDHTLSHPLPYQLTRPHQLPHWLVVCVTPCSQGHPPAPAQVYDIFILLKMTKPLDHQQPATTTP